MNTTNTNSNDTLSKKGTPDSIPIATIATILFVTALSVLAMGLLSWYFNRFFFCCCKQGDACSNSDLNHDSVVEEGQCESESENDTTSTIPSIVTISKRGLVTNTRWGRRRRSTTRQKSPDIPLADDRNTKQKQGRSSQQQQKQQQPSKERQFSRSNRSREQRRRRRRRHRHGRSSFGVSRSLATSLARSTESSPNGNIAFDHTTVVTSSCDNMSFPDEDCCIDVAAADATFESKRNKGHKAATTNTAAATTTTRSSLDLPGGRLEEESYPNATIQFRTPINGRNNGNCYFEGGEIDILVDFLVHTEDYIFYPRSKLTILLREIVPETQEALDKLQHIRAIIADAAACGQSSLPVFITSVSRSRRSHSSSEEDLLRCAPTGGILVTFGSVWELPQDHPDFLRDLVG